MRKLVTLVAAVASFLGLTATLSAGALAAGASTPATHRYVARPVHADGTPVRGYVVRNESEPGFTCDEGASPVAVDPDIRFCGPSATYTVACWKSTSHTVLCLRDARTRTLYRIHYVGSFGHVAKPRHPSPQVLRLGNHACLIRDGGAWGTVAGHPNWNGFYSCDRATGEVWGPGSGDGISRRTPTWMVWTVQFTSPPKITKRAVTIAYYVGTAH